MQKTVGASFLGFQGYSRSHCQDALSFFDGVDRKVLGFLWNSFSSRRMNIKRWGKITDDRSVTQVYFSNEVDRRKNREDKGNLFTRVDVGAMNRRLENKHQKTIKAVQRRAKKIYNTWKRYCKGELRIAIGLEDQWTRQAAINLAATIREVVPPEVKLIRNFVNMAPDKSLAGCDYIEFHGMGYPAPTIPYVVCNDGADICASVCGRNIDSYIDENHLKSFINERYSTADYFMLWHSSFNGLTRDSQFMPPPRERKSAIDRRCIQELRQFLPPSSGHAGDSGETCFCATPEDHRKRVENRGGTGYRLRPGEHPQDPTKDSGFLWKESEHGGLVILFPPRFSKPFDRVVVVEPRQDGQGRRGRRHKLDFSGLGNPWGNTDRQHWRKRSKPASSFMEFSIVRGIYRKGFLGLGGREIHSWKIERPSDRIEGR